MKPPKCPTCRTKTDLVTCHCRPKPRQVYFCWTCQKHYSLAAKK